MVVDWRARISLPFYRASRTEPMGVGLRRRFGFQHGEMTAFEDERARPSPAAADEHSAHPGGRDRAPPRRADARHRGHHPARAGRDRPGRPRATSVCVQGAPGTGKTAVGLHRAAYLLYAHRDQLRPAGRPGGRPERDLPALHRRRAARARRDRARSRPPSRSWSADAARLNARYAIRGEDDPTVATLKGDARMAEVLRRARVVAAAPRRPRRWWCRAASRRWRVPAYEVGGDRRRAARPRSPVRRGAGDAAAAAGPRRPGADGGRRRLPRRPGAGRGGPQPPGQGGTPTQLWPAVDPARLVLPAAHRRRTFLAEHADGILTAERAGAAALGEAAQVGRRRRSGPSPTPC